MKTIFLDRDGTINKDYGYVCDPNKFEFEEYAIEGLKKLQELQFQFIIITNQSGIGRKYYTIEDMQNVHNKMIGLLNEQNIHIQHIYFCPHDISENCNCRKPKIGMLRMAEKDYNININESYFIGDKTSDVQCGNNFGLKTILKKTGIGGVDSATPNFIAKNLLEAAYIIASNA
jgi:D,D-heptose 1,7-bisphosphate phosphatase